MGYRPTVLPTHQAKAAQRRASTRNRLRRERLARDLAERHGLTRR